MPPPSDGVLSGHVSFCGQDDAYIILITDFTVPIIGKYQKLLDWFGIYINFLIHKFKMFTFYLL